MNRKQSREGNNRGITLVEIIVTVAVAGIFIVPLMGMFVFASGINSRSHEEFKAVMLAQAYVEQLKAMDGLDRDKYMYNSLTGKYELFVPETENDFGVEAVICQEGIICYIIIYIRHEGETICILNGSRILIE
ncbi:MAG: prepilin-type N-terminal cleavage/methylation domain-containing protein [Sedimentibacter sp.]|uniref:type IV pilus modification PilV family protein n=1 Tax=Sedimentibacter sp. TaxID=1960295 RepID=UPI0031593314